MEVSNRLVGANRVMVDGGDTAKGDVQTTFKMVQSGKRVEGEADRYIYILDAFIWIFLRLTPTGLPSDAEPFREHKMVTYMPAAVQVASLSFALHPPFGPAGREIAATDCSRSVSSSSHQHQTSVLKLLQIFCSMDTVPQSPSPADPEQQRFLSLTCSKIQRQTCFFAAAVVLTFSSSNLCSPSHLPSFQECLICRSQRAQ